MYGWSGQALEVDLSTGQSSILQLSATVLHQTLGGRGLAGHLLRVRSPNLDTPTICLASGPFCGGNIQTAERLVAVFRSPLTTGIFDNSAGCSFASALKGSGFDALLLKGAANSLTHLQIDKAGGRLLSAVEMAGLDTEETLSLLGDPASLVIGPAGENQVRYASVVASAGEPLSRGGLGAVFGRMNLKAISASGERTYPLADEKAYLKAKADVQRLYHASPLLYGPLGIGACGTSALLDLTQARQMLPSVNFRHRSYPDPLNVSAYRLKQRSGFADDPCPVCQIACRKKDAAGGLPEYDSRAHFSALLGLNDLELPIAADRACQHLGLDPVSAAVVLATYLDGKDNPATAENLITKLEDISYRRAEGNALADGLKAYVEKVADGATAFCVKGLEMPAFDPRGAYGLALSLALSCSGEYRHALTYFHELLRKPVPTDPFSFAGKARIVLQAEDAVAACDSLSICRHTLVAAGLEEYAALLSAVTGQTFDATTLANSGRQTIMRERWLNQQYGFSGREDSLPEIFFMGEGIPSSDGPVSALPFSEFDAERKRYYRLRGLNEKGQLLSEPVEPA